MPKKLEIEIDYHKNQKKILFLNNARYKIVAKGRRFGLTRGLAHYVMDNMLEGVSPILWVDTIYSNIERYIERYFLPALKELPKSMWKYRTNRNDLKINNSVCDFRSADKPENIEGFGYELIILNEAGIILKNRRLWEESIRPMILDYKAKVIIGGTPKGKRVKKTNETHLFYELFQRGLSNTGDPSQKLRINDSQWESFNFSSYDNPMIDAKEIDELANDISPSLRDQEIFGKFVDKETSGIIKSDWWRYFEPESIYKQRILKIVQSWDTAFKDKETNDFSVCTTWIVGLSGYYLIDMWRDRIEFPELKRKCSELYEIHSPNEVLIEDKASGQSLIQELERETKLPVKPIKVDSDKIARVHAVTPLIEAGKVYLPLNTPWTKTVTDECEDFPDGEFDDIVDSISQFLNYAKGKKTISKEPITHVKRSRVLDKYRKFRTLPSP
jgi:predicted phage terminase large subunit-like protein